MASRESIAGLAYQLWIARGRPHGSHDQDWLEAERQLCALEESPVSRAAAVAPESPSPSSNSRGSTSDTGRKPRGNTPLARESAGGSHDIGEG
jgi:hypothetical protein